MDNLVTFTNAANKTTNYTYDLEGNLTSIKDPARPVIKVSASFFSKKEQKPP